MAIGAGRRDFHECARSGNLFIIKDERLSCFTRLRGGVNWLHFLLKPWDKVCYSPTSL